MSSSLCSSGMPVASISVNSDRKSCGGRNRSLKHGSKNGSLKNKTPQQAATPPQQSRVPKLTWPFRRTMLYAWPQTSTKYR